MKLVAYVRVSRVAGRNGESFISPDVQREQIESGPAAIAQGGTGGAEALAERIGEPLAGEDEI